MSLAFLGSFVPQFSRRVFTILQAWGWVFEPHQLVGTRRGRLALCQVSLATQT